VSRSSIPTRRSSDLEPADEPLGPQLLLRESLGGDEPGKHEADVYAVAALLEVQAIAPSGQCELAGRVGGRAGTRDATGGARHVDDRARCGGAQERPQRLGQPYHGVEVDRHRAVDVLPAALGEG